MKELKIIGNVFIPFIMAINILLFSKAVMFYYCFRHHLTIMCINNSIYMKFAYVGSLLGDISTVIILLIIFIINKNKLQDFKNAFKLHIDKKHLLKMLSITFILYLIVYLIQSLFIKKGISTVPKYEIVIIIFLIPFLEEIIFRFFIFNGLRKHLNIYIVILVQAILFAFTHMIFNERAIFQGIYTFILGIILGFTYNKNKNLNESYCCHLFFNSMSLIIIPLFCR